MAIDPDLIDQLWQIHNSDERRQANLLRAYSFDSTRSWVDPNGYTLSTRVWRARRAIYDQIDAVLRDAIARGTDALEVADILEQYLNPDHAPVRNALGRLIRNQKKSIVTRAPGRGGMGSFSARRLARTEITRAHGMATIETAKRTPFATGVKWNLSGSHPRSDPCDENSRRDEYRLGPGVYPPEKVPQYPNHPQCLCNLSTATEGDVDSVVARLREQYSLGEIAPEETVTEVMAPPSAAPALPKGKDGIRGWFQALGVQIGETQGNAETWRRVAEVFATELQRGGRLPRAITFERGSARSAPASFNMFFDHKTNRRTREFFQINTNSRYWKDPAAVTREQFQKGFWSSDDPMHVVTHEFAHMKHADFVDIDIFTAEMKVPGSGTFPTTLRWFMGDPEYDIVRRVSEYATHSRLEFVAETYAGMRSGKVYDDEVMALYRQFGGPTP